MVIKGDNAAALADAYLDAKAELMLIEARVEKLRSQILDTARSLLEGERGIVTVTLHARSTLDANAVRKLLSPLQMAKCMKTASGPVVRVQSKGAKK